MIQQLKQVIGFLVDDLTAQAREEGEAAYFGRVITFLCDSGLGDVARLVAVARKRELAKVLIVEEST